MEIDKIVKKLLIRYPLFGNVIANLKFKFTNENVPASAFTDGKNIFYKQEFIDDYSDAEKEFIIAHEIFHIVLKHIFRNLGKDSDLLNYVEDAIINQMLVRDGLTMPEGLVNVEDALDYSVEELYMRFLPRLDEIKEWMGVNTYHIDLSNLDDLFAEMFGDDVQEMMSQNDGLRDDILNDFKDELKYFAYSNSGTEGKEETLGDIGSASPLLCWKELLKANINNPEEVVTLFYEVEMDGIVRREEKSEPSFSESEIIIDTSGSMNLEKLKAILRECKNILKDSRLKIGFCDTRFYEWIDVSDCSVIDKISIKGRGGTDFGLMAESFSGNVDNKIVITDGYGSFPENYKDVLWIIVDYYFPSFVETEVKEKDINYIFINEQDVVVEKNKCLVLTK